VPDRENENANHEYAKVVLEWRTPDHEDRSGDREHTNAAPEP